ncbi:hypothetical protein [Polyangium sp. y55x31]|uniref:hypothetical protein n=1 Tax=Polyangium sp. y55x31 TaxID=3042688 RepID=UPI002482690B|nr:hypothetical protein [Polyangium sp. y55x31]MDI1480123.1 hypothetical protein [Polyangium sp. y55x31]
MRIVWLAAADARGHLMRAHLVRGLLARRGIRVDVMTTSEEGRTFLQALGTPSELLSAHYSLAYDAHQNMARARTEACILRYLFTPSRGAADLGRLSEFARGAAYVVNDFHPLLLLGGSRPAGEGHALPCPVVHVYGENIWRAIEGHFEGRGPAIAHKGFGALVRALRDRAHARIEHTLAAPLAGDGDPARRSYRLLPIVAAPQRSAADVRASLGLAPGARLAAVYLNPHFADPAVASAIEESLAAEGYVMHAVGEGYTARPAWRPYDPDFGSVAAAADLLVSAPGMGAVGMARIFGVPLLALLTDQPEQRQNTSVFASCPAGAFAGVELDAPGRLEARLRGSLRALGPSAGAALARPSASALVGRIHESWARILFDIAASAPARRMLSVSTQHQSEVHS